MRHKMNFWSKILERLLGLLGRRTVIAVLALGLLGALGLYLKTPAVADAIALVAISLGATNAAQKVFEARFLGLRNMRDDSLEPEDRGSTSSKPQDSGQEQDEDDRVGK